MNLELKKYLHTLLANPGVYKPASLAVKIVRITLENKPV